MNKVEVEVEVEVGLGDPFKRLVITYSYKNI